MSVSIRKRVYIWAIAFIAVLFKTMTWMFATYIAQNVLLPGLVRLLKYSTERPEVSLALL